MKLSVVIPSYNEVESIRPSLERVASALQGEDFEIIIVDDDSPDGTWKIVEKESMTNPQIRLVRRIGEKGLASAIAAGIREARGDAVAWLDCDLQHPPAKLVELKKILENGADVASASRFFGRGSRSGDSRLNDRSGAFIIRFHGFLSIVLNSSISIICRSKLTDWTSGMVAFRKSVLDQLIFKGDHGEYLMSLLFQAEKRGFKVEEIPYVLSMRELGHSKSSTTYTGLFQLGTKYLKTLWMLAKNTYFGIKISEVGSLPTKKNSQLTTGETMENIFKTNCRLCGSDKLRDVISLGEQYINDFPDSPAQKGRNGKCPLDIIVCDSCTLFQLRHTAPQELLYSRHYWYKSGVNDTIKADLKEITEIATSLVDLKKDDVYLDIGANDGTMLKNLKGKAISVGCEPASNIQDELRQNCDHVIHDFWNETSYNKLGLKKAKIITAFGMFYDMEDPNQFIRDAARVLHENGVFIAQLMTLKPMLDSLDLGNICHEHLEYYTYASLKFMFERNGLEIFKIEENGINGGSYRIFARHLKTGSIDWKETCGEKDLVEFKKRLDDNKEKCLTYLADLNRRGKKVYVYGASTKGNAILQYYGIDQTMIVAAADKNELKWGKYMLTDIPICSEEEARAKADAFLVLPFGFIDEFVRREKEWLDKGGEFLVPLPTFRVIKSQAKQVGANL